MQSCGDRVRAAPGKAVGADEHGEELLAGPQLQGLHQRGLRQVHGVHAVAHEAGKLRHLRAAVEAVFARKQECRRQEVLRMSNCPESAPTAPLITLTQLHVVSLKASQHTRDAENFAAEHIKHR